MNPVRVQLSSAGVVSVQSAPPEIPKAAPVAVADDAPLAEGLQHRAPPARPTSIANIEVTLSRLDATLGDNVELDDKRLYQIFAGVDRLQTQFARASEEHALEALDGPGRDAIAGRIADLRQRIEQLAVEPWLEQDKQAALDLLEQHLHALPSVPAVVAAVSLALGELGHEPWPELAAHAFPAWLESPEKVQQHQHPRPLDPAELHAEGVLTADPSTGRTLNKSHRFAMLADFVASRFPEGARVADVGGGNGALSLLLNQRGFASTVIDPDPRPLPDRMRQETGGKLAAVDGSASVPGMVAYFDQEIGKDFDLMIGLHAHGSNRAMIDTVADQGNAALLFVCCVQGETPPPQGEEWSRWLYKYALSQGLNVEPVYLPFAGRNLGLLITKNA